MDKTPIQTAIEYWKQIQKQEIIASTITAASAGVFIEYLESLLPKEKEFASRVWDAADNRAEEERNYPYGKRGDNWKYPAKHEFLNQLYPEK